MQGPFTVIALQKLRRVSILDWVIKPKSVIGGCFNTDNLDLILFQWMDAILAGISNFRYITEKAESLDIEW